MQPSFGTIIVDALGVLMFRRPSAAISEHWPSYLAFGLFFTGLAGIGRYWDNPRAEWWQQLGLGSIAYVFVLALLLWFVVAPLRPKRWSYQSVLVFLTLTAPPAVLYAIPVERFLPLSDAQAANAWFLFVVAAWRVALLVWFLRSAAGLSGGAVGVATLLPLTLIIVALGVLNLEHVVFEIMSGNRGAASGNDMAYGVVFLLTSLSLIAAPFLFIAYVVLVFRAYRREGES
jgi:hypothetical protein